MKQAWLESLSIDNKDLRYKFWIIVALVLPLPFSLFLYILYSNHILFALAEYRNAMIILLAFTLVACVLALLHEIFSRFLAMAETIKEAASDNRGMTELTSTKLATSGTRELQEISEAVNRLLQQRLLVDHERERGSQIFTALRELADIARKSLDMDVLLNALMEKAAEVTGARVASVFLAEKERKRFRILGTRGFKPADKGPAYVPFDKSVARHVMESKEPLLVSDVSVDPRLNRANEEKYGTSSFVCMPVVLDGELIAVVNLTDKASGEPFDENDVGALSVMLDEIHFALENAQIHAAIKAHALDLEVKTAELNKEISKRQQIENELQRLAHNDALTGLSNRALFLDRLQQGLLQAKRRKQKVAVMFLDLDGFKPINDMLGHDQGDIVLQEVARRLTGCLRAMDIVARHGGDEFTFALLDVKGPEDISIVAHKVLACLKRPFELNGQEHFVGGSIGISMYPDDGDQAESLVNQADTAMYLAKKGGGNSFRFYTQELGEEARQRLQLELELRHALKRDQFILYYQPQIDLAQGRLSGLEALIRWQHPEHGLVPPVQFIPMAEKIGLIEPIGDWVLRSACDQQRAWREQGIAPITVVINISVNISAHQFRAGDFIQTISEVLDKTGMDPTLLELEITEGILMEHADSSVTLLKELKDMGVRLAIDDFGTGFSSLSYLKRFPIDTLKIDRSFVMHLPVDGSDAAIVRAIIGLAQSMGIKTIAEGVETKEQMKFLQEIGCDEIQGFLFGRPMPPEEMGQLLRDEKVMREWRSLLALEPERG